MTAMAD